MNGLLWLMLILASPLPAAEEGVTGIFLTIDCRRDIPKYHQMMSTKSICLTQSPIMVPRDFESIGNVKDFGSNVFFDLKFTPKGYETLLKLTANLPDSKLALVVEDEVFFVFKSRDLKVAPTFRFQTTMKFKNQMVNVHQKLVAAMESSAGS